MIFFVTSQLSGAEFNVSDVDSLRSAIAISQYNDEPDTINIAPGVYNVKTPLIYSPGVSQKTSDLTVKGGKGSVVLSGSKNISIFRIEIDGDKRSKINIQSIAFENGNGGDEYGGGLRIKGRNIDVLVEDCIFKGNSASSGAGLYAEINYGSIVLVNSFFMNNSADYQGGGSYTYLEHGNVIVSGNIYSRNDTGSLGGGLYAMVNYGELVLTNNTIAQNVSTFGSGAHTGIAQEDDRAFFFNNIIWNNRNKNNELAGNELFINNYIYSDTTDTKNVTLKNNAFINTQTNVAVNISNMAKVISEDNTLENPIFRDYLRDDYRLMPHSKLIDAGYSDAKGITDYDIFGNSRKINSNDDGYAKIDIGAVEFVYTVDIKKFYDYGGVIQSDKCGIDCGEDCQGIYKKNEKVILNVVETPFETFSYWGADCGGCYQKRSCEINIDDIKTCEAFFDKKISVNKRGLAVFVEDFCSENLPGGVVKFIQQDESCIDKCVYSLENAREVTLLAVPYDGYSFAGWESDFPGIDCGADDNCTFGITKNVQIKAKFVRNFNFSAQNGVYIESLSNNFTATCSEPIAFGKISGCSSAVDLNVKIPKFDIPVDAYLGFYAPSLDDDSIYLIDRYGDLIVFNGVFDNVSKFQDNLSGAVFNYPLRKWYPNQDGIKVPDGEYDFYLLITPASEENLLKDYYLYKSGINF